MNVSSALYSGEIEHRRLYPVRNVFSYSVCYYFLDLEEIPGLFRIPLLFSYNKPGILSFWDKDYLNSESIRALIKEQTHQTSSGPIRLLTNISYFGFCFNPVSFYYCYNNHGTSLEYIVSEITNTPWGEKHSQVFTCTENDKNTFKFLKNFHVSPFMPMTLDYTWVFERPDVKLNILMQNRDRGESTLLFDSNLKLERKNFTVKNVLSVFIRFPFLTFKTMLAIYFQALKLYLKKVPFHSHPSKEEAL